MALTPIEPGLFYAVMHMGGSNDDPERALVHSLNENYPGWRRIVSITEPTKIDTTLGTMMRCKLGQPEKTH